ncbi:EutP/PduV family microcompartment system protein [Lentilactobacillus raoultii]|uniref:EutP/PduV family microcompartment system protein n=1 Tax=Lentilactobacillus raoultii TaxID=1987503 RepID=A0ABW3PHM2_9LACO|nr:EutP/PduV family microcompartment system protein [Lentilactobacillus raoultii]
MRKAMFVGAVGCGKTTLIQRLHNQKINYDKTQAVEFSDDIIDTPGEFVEHRYLYPSLMTTSVEADLVVILQSATDSRAIFPAGFTTMFPSKTIGVITKIDAANESQLKYAKDRLIDAGVSRIFELSALTGKDVDQLRDFLKLSVTN